jgi:hypothetical protein
MYTRIQGTFVLLAMAAGTALAATLIFWWAPAVAAEPAATVLP